MALTKWAFVAGMFIACAPSRAAEVPSSSFDDTAGARRALIDPAARFTVIEFFSAHCPCQAVHDARLAALAKKYRASSVSFVAVDSEAGVNLVTDRAEALRRGYEYPILLDPHARAARALHADYATYTVVVDA
ncbi:MAG TPA: hypothetical protein VGM29_01400, partial [Polyangiaceae bacterium]